jgi:hypothetical protein
MFLDLRPPPRVELVQRIFIEGIFRDVIRFHADTVAFPGKSSQHISLRNRGPLSHTLRLRHQIRKSARVGAQRLVLMARM